MNQKQIIVTCDNCKSLIAFSDKMPLEEAEKTKSRLVINPFGAPRCKKCRHIEPYSDINLCHTIAIADFDPNRSFDQQEPQEKEHCPKCEVIENEMTGERTCINRHCGCHKVE